MLQKALAISLEVVTFQEEKKIRLNLAGINTGLEITSIFSLIITIRECAVQRTKQCLRKKALITLFLIA